MNPVRNYESFGTTPTIAAACGRKIDYSKTNTLEVSTSDF